MLCENMIAICVLWKDVGVEITSVSQPDNGSVKKNEFMPLYSVLQVSRLR